MPPRGRPRFNHLALTLPPEALDQAGRAQILRFFGEVFAWTEVPELTEDRQRLVMRVYEVGQFLYLLGSDDCLKAPRSDHFGIQVDTVEELDAMLGRARAFRERDSRVEIVDREVEHHGRLVLTSFYVRYMLPLMLEVQHYELRETAQPAMSG
jgi:hypothetical protein